MIFPTYLHTPDDSLAVKGWYSLNYDTFYSNCAILSSALGVPEVSIPIAYHSKGAGIGMEIAGLKGSEELLLNLAYSYTEHFDTRKAPTESAPNLYTSDLSLQDLIDQAQEPPLPVTEATEVTEAPTTSETVTECTEETETATDSGDEETDRRGTSGTAWIAALMVVPAIVFAISYGKKLQTKKASIIQFLDKLV